eukprot:scaffold4859_cov128-Isochrysis_galbana.AAC.1
MCVRAHRNGSTSSTANTAGGSVSSLPAYPSSRSAPEAGSTTTARPPPIQSSGPGLPGMPAARSRTRASSRPRMPRGGASASWPGESAGASSSTCRAVDGPDRRSVATSPPTHQPMPVCWLQCNPNSSQVRLSFHLYDKGEGAE